MGIFSAVTDLAGSFLGANASKKAASIQDRAAQAAADRTMAQYQQARTDLKPYSDIGAAGVGRLSDLMGLSGNANVAGYGDLTRNFSMADFQADPGYQFRFDEGMKALQRSASAKGGVFSGAAGKALQTFGQNIASDEYQRAFDRYNDNQSTLFNRLSGVTNIGQNAVNSQNTLGAAATQQANDFRISGANARAAGKVGAANQYMSGLSSLGSLADTMFGIK